MRSGLVLSLFPGADLLGRAFEEAGFCVVKGPDVVWGGDVRTFHPPASKFDGVIGGPPCQMFSPLAHLVRTNGNEPKFGNLIPEYERCVREAQPAWFLMEEVPAAPVPVVQGYAVDDFILCNEMLDSGNGIGNAQIRKRRFSFGVGGTEKINLRKWIMWAALELPDAAPTILGQEIGMRTKTRPVMTGTGNSLGALGWDGGKKVPPVLAAGFDAGPRPQSKQRAVLADPRVAPTGDAAYQYEIKKERPVLAQAPNGTRLDENPNPKRSGRTLPHVGKKRSWEESCVLQGLPPDFLAQSPFTKDGKFSLLGNGVPLSMGRQLAYAITQALKARSM